MRKLLRFTVILASLGGWSFAAPFMVIGDGAELFLTGNLGVRADDNIFLAQNAVSDVIFDISPALDLTFGKDAQLKGGFTLTDAFTSYSDNSRLNTQLLSANFVARYDD